ncbi:SIS domain-containing protein [Cyanobium sp. WAJ14-Wanaka]|uniref:SIS domain-containing protein n=1 Tax=Cyanobium sp. WAJ14-Wanaka TaxID=2823725 RepID=UPI0020CD7AEC|nr:SIS domain-containing protein [Cyanobium sp. WAJ14-Wanaka]MCP9775661.1 SIS domain-containing protein [Cyanobium sp. WAJ14-Wanaka]
MEIPVIAASTQTSFAQAATSYLQRLQGCFNAETLGAIETLAGELRLAWIEGRQVFICGNGGSAANALHLANDFIYGIGACGLGPKLPGLRVEALPANAGVITCLANDTGYANIYSYQLEVKARKGDLVIVLSGSGNSANVVRALETAKTLKMRSFAILAFNGGRCLELADVPIHFPIEDMQIAEDTQLVVGHLCMQWLNTNKPSQIER